MAISSLKKWILTCKSYPLSRTLEVPWFWQWEEDPVHTSPPHLHRGGPQTSSHVGGAYSASPLKTGSEPWGNPRALPAGRPSRQYRFLKHQGFSRDLARNAGSASFLQNRGMEHGRNCMGAGGEKNAEVSDHKRVPERIAVVVLAILVCLFLLAALGYSVKWLLKMRQREPLLGEPSFPLWSKDPDNVEKERKMEEIAKEIESLPEGPCTLLRPPPNALHEN